MSAIEKVNELWEEAVELAKCKEYMVDRLRASLGIEVGESQWSWGKRKGVRLCPSLTPPQNKLSFKQIEYWFYIIDQTFQTNHSPHDHRRHDSFLNCSLISDFLGPCKNLKNGD